MMHNRLFPIAAASMLLAACGSSSKPSVPPPSAAAEMPKPKDESRRFPQANLVDSKVVEQHLLGKSFMPGGTLAHYKKGKLEYDMFVAELATPLDAADILPDWRKALTDAKLEPAFGGYSGSDAGRPVFIFTRGRWIAGVAGLPEKQADERARLLAAYLD